MTTQGLIVLLIMVALFAAAVVWISHNGGWRDDEGCHGNCAECHAKCETKGETKQK